MVLNTTSGPIPVPGREPTRHHVNTSRVVEEDMTYLDEEPEILSVLPAGDWQAVVNGQHIPLIAFVAMDSGKMHGVVVGPDGRVDLTEDNVETYAGFSSYTK
jgi:hypothetical protein